MFFFPCFCASSANAEFSLNIGQAPMLEQTSSARANATKEALQQVLVKLSGTQSVLSDSAMKSLLNNAQNYVEASRFIAQPYVGLEVEFDQTRLEQWLKDQQLPLWGEQRPHALLWLIYQDPLNDEREIIHAASEHVLKIELEQATQRRAIPISLPIYDLQDVAAVAPIDIWGQFVDTLYDASERYQVNSTLAARIYPNAEFLWQLDGFVKEGDLLRLVSFTAVDTQTLINKFVDFYTEFTAERFAIDTKQFANDQRINYSINISGVSNIEILAEVQRFLENLSIVDDFRHVSQHGNTAIFELNLLATQERLQATFKQGGRLIPKLSTNGSQVLEPDNSNYQWQP
nr:DUF2066 domain-containing protein [Alteromonas sp. LMIT006]